MLSSIDEASFKEDLLGFKDFQFGQGAMSLETLTVSGVLAATNARRDAQRAKRDFQPVPADACTRNATLMEAAGRDPVLEHVGRYAFGDLGNMAPVVGDEICHFFTDLGVSKEELTPGWADGKITSLNRSKATFEVLYSDGLKGLDTELNSNQYGEDKLWVLLKKTTADVANKKPARGRLVHR